MALSSYMDIYCERVEPGLWSEPINAASNLSFFIAAYLLWRSYRQNNKSDMPLALLIASVALVGAGSLTFHTLASFGAMLLDVIPIALFVFGYLFLAMLRILDWSITRTLFWLAGFAVATGLCMSLPEDYNLNGSAMYLPCVAAVLGFVIATSAQKLPQLTLFYGALASFSLSLVLRTLDMKMCPAFPLGTHFFWHLLNGLVIYLLVRTLQPVHNRS